MSEVQGNNAIAEESLGIDCFVLKSNYELAAFQRAAYLELFANVDVPAKISEAKFGEASEIYWQFLLMQGRYDLKYKAEIGYDRTEQYWATEKEYKNGQTYEKKVLKERTVTDWQPYSGEDEGEAWSSSMIVNPMAEYFASGSDAGEYSQTSRFETCLSKADRLGDIMSEYAQSGCDERPVAPTGTNRDNALLSGAAEVAINIKSKLPGDHYRNFDYSSKSEVISEMHVTVPAYQLPFELEGEKYAVDAYAVNNDVHLTKAPKEDAGGDIKEKQKLLRRLTRYIPMGISFLLAFIFMATGNEDAYWSFMLLGIGYVIAHAVFFHFKNKKETEKAHELSQEAKKQALEEIFKKLGMQPMSAAELAYFDAWKMKK
ncbi:MAG: hypothetical protein IJX98_02435 [Clostridia bacterium]|nr:hypothetical protein [Clostridia bacterium]